MTFKKPEMDKILKNGLSMSETDPLNHKWLDFAIYFGLALHQLKLPLMRFEKWSLLKQLPQNQFHSIVPNGLSLTN